MIDFSSWVYDDFFNDEQLKLIAYDDDRIQAEDMARKAAKKQRISSRVFDKRYQQLVRELKLDQKMLKMNALTWGDQSFHVPYGWRYSAIGIEYIGGDTPELACDHLILPIKRYQNLETGTEKLHIVFRRGGMTRDFQIDKTVTSIRQKIVQLSAYGVGVNSENAALLVRWFTDFEAINYYKIASVPSASRLGWLGVGFVPFASNVEFDGTEQYRTIYNALHEPQGTLEDWIAAVQSARRDSVYVRLALATAFAAPLLSRVGALCSFTHFWSSQSSTGKTVLLMIAASVWGDPGGGYIQTCRATDAGSEYTAAFLNNVPYVMDELQLARDVRGRLNFDVYALAQGKGKTRSQRGGGMAQTPEWLTTFITSGETPIVSNRDGAGAHARVLQCEINEQVFSRADGNRIVSALKQNYGTAGRAFVAAFEGEYTIEYNMIADELTAQGVQSKQAMTAAALILADRIADEAIFRDEIGRLTPDDVLPFLQSDSDVGLAERALELVENFVFSNAERFSDTTTMPKAGRVLINPDDSRTAFIITDEVRDLFESNGFNYDATLADMRRRGVIEATRNKRGWQNTTTARIDGGVVRVIKFNLQKSNAKYEL